MGIYCVCISLFLGQLGGREDQELSVKEPSHCVHSRCLKASTQLNNPRPHGSCLKVHRQLRGALLQQPAAANLMATSL